jgi:phosphoribosylglycinamide formyltransferase-1
MEGKIRIGALVSGGGTNLQAIIDACEAGDIAGQMVFVGADNPDAYGLERAQKHGIDTFVVDYRDIIRQFDDSPDGFALPADCDLVQLEKRQTLMAGNTDRRQLERFLKTRAAAEAQMLNALAQRPFDLLVLAGFMRNLTPYFIDRVNTDPSRPRIMNIHPALLPAFPGTDGYGDTFRYGCKVGGCTVHFIDYGEDSGPIIGQRCFPIQPDDDLDTVKRNGLEQEWLLYPECIQWFAENRLETVSARFDLAGGRVVQRTHVRIKPA